MAEVQKKEILKIEGNNVAGYESKKEREKNSGTDGKRGNEEEPIKLQWMKEKERYALILLKVSWISGGLIEFEMSQEAES